MVKVIDQKLMSCKCDFDVTSQHHSYMMSWIDIIAVKGLRIKRCQTCMNTGAFSYIDTDVINKVATMIGFSGTSLYVLGKLM